MIDTDYTGQLLLRGYSLGDYTGRQWEVPAYGVPEIDSPGTLFSLSSSWTDAAVRAVDETNEYFFGIYPSSSFAENESEIMFTPYFTDRAAFTTVFDSDCMTLVNKGMPYSGYFAVPQSMWELTDVHVASGENLRAFLPNTKRIRLNTTLIYPTLLPNSCAITRKADRRT